MKGSYVIEQQGPSRSDGCCSPVYMDEFQTVRRKKESYVDQEVLPLCTLNVNMDSGTIPWGQQWPLIYMARMDLRVSMLKLT